MKYINIPKGNNQKVYIDTRWVPEAYINYLLENEYDVISDSSLVTDDTFFLTPCLDEHINKEKNDYVSKKMKKLRECFAGEEVCEPLTITFPSDKFPETTPSLPFVMKNIEENGGFEKFIVRTPEQLNLLKRFYKEINDYDFEYRVKSAQKSWSCLGEIIFDRITGHSNKGISLFIYDYKDIFHERIVLQEYVETPTIYNTSMRVLTSSTGEILCASLKYMEPSLPDENKRYHGYFDTYLSDPSSPYFLGNESIISNTVAGGNSILLRKNNYSAKEKEILSAHNINTDTGKVPDSVARVATKIAIHCRREIGAISGMDFIYDNKSKTWKFLEQHEFPMLTTYAQAHNIPLPEDDLEECAFHRELDLNVRLHALINYMNKKYSQKKDSKKLNLK